MAISPETRIGAVRLTVADLDREREFYQRVLGLRPIEPAGEPGPLRLGADGTALVELAGDPDAPPRPRGATGLFHLAILHQDRAELARALRRLAGAGWPLGGTADHLVSEALYMADPEGNGIELYRDRPRADWRRTNGGVEMATLPLDLDSLLAEPEAGGDEADPAAPSTRVGHVHLQVGDLEAAESFYAGALGLEVTTREYPGALFVSAGGYHHHVGLNTWAGRGALAPPAGSLGLRWFEIVVPDGGELAHVERSILDAGGTAESGEGGVLTRDPSGNGVLLRAASG
jgi:catechol 2,3-dioxygenase